MKSSSPLLLLALATSLPLTGWADGRFPYLEATPSMIGQPAAKVADMSDTDRSRLRQQWQDMPPGERENMRRQMKERWRDMPPEQRQSQRRELMDNMHGKPGISGDANQEQPEDAGYGRGFEHRRWGNGRR